MQNSLPSGSASTIQPVPGPHLPRMSRTSVAPCSSSRASSSSRVPLARHQVEVDPVLGQLGVGHLDEQHLVAGLRVADHALLVARLVGVALEVDVAEHRLPPLGELVGVAAVDGRVRDVRRHAASLPAGTDRAQRDCPRGRRTQIGPNSPPGGTAWPIEASLVLRSGDDRSWGILCRGRSDHVRPSPASPRPHAGDVLPALGPALGPRPVPGLPGPGNGAARRPARVEPALPSLE